MLASCMIPAVAFSQEQKDMKQEKAAWEKQLKDELKMSDEQFTKYQALNAEYKDKMEAVEKDATLSKEDQKEKHMALKKERHGKFLALLSEEQQTKYKELLDKKKKESKPGN